MMLLFIPILALNLVQTWQYTHLVIHPNSMNREKYQHVFLRTDSAVVNCLGGIQEMASYGTNQVRPVKILLNDFEKAPDNWNSLARVKTTAAFSGEYAGYLDSVHPFSSGIVFPVKQLGRLPSAFFVEGEVMVWDSLKGASNNALVVLSMDSISPGENWWQGFRLNDVPVTSMKQWRRCNFSLMTPEISNARGILKIYIWNTGKKPMLIDDFVVRFYGSR